MREPTQPTALTVAALANRRVITAAPDTPFRELVGTMIVHDLDALPVIDITGRPLGVVADGDVLTKFEFHNGTDRPPLLAGSHCRARWRKSSGTTAADLMTTPATTISEHAPLTEAARCHLLRCGVTRFRPPMGTRASSTSMSTTHMWTVRVAPYMPERPT